VVVVAVVELHPRGEVDSVCSTPFREKLPNCSERLVEAALSHLPILRYCFGLEELDTAVRDSALWIWMSFGEPGTTVGKADAVSDDATATGVSNGLPRAHAFGVVEVLLSVVVDGHSPIPDVETSNEPHPDEIRGDSIFFSTFFGERIFSAGSFTTGSDGLVF
jgi:hypothetical protein